MKALLLGGTGAMGTPLAQILTMMGYKVDITSRKNHCSDCTESVRFFQGDGHNELFLRNILSENHYEAIIDFLKYTPEEFKERIGFLLNGTEQYFLLSSCRVYADSKEAIREESIRLIDTDIPEEEFKTEEYALTKAREEDILIGTGKKNWTIVRPYLTYNDYRLQLGFYEKDHWLNRALTGNTVLFPAELLKKHTTLTYGGDVAKCIALLIGKSNAYGQVFHITTEEAPLWEDVLFAYSSIIKNCTGIMVKFSFSEEIKSFYDLWPSALIEYDRIYNRVFDCSKLKKVIGDDFKFLSYEKGIELCIRNFLNKPLWQGQYIEYEAWMDRIFSENTSLLNIKGKKAKLKYLMYRYGTNKKRHK